MFKNIEIEKINRDNMQVYFFELRKTNNPNNNNIIEMQNSFDVPNVNRNAGDNKRIIRVKNLCSSPMFNLFNIRWKSIIEIIPVKKCINVR